MTPPVRCQGQASPICRSTASKIWGLCRAARPARAFIPERNTAPGGKLPLNTNGGGLSYMHSGMYGMYALQESVRQMRGTAPAQIPDAEISVCHGVGGMFAASGTIIMSNEAP
jgi:Thiolase C-terminal domain-like